jgi:hypothetical protein
MAATALAQARAVARSAEDRRIRAATQLPRAIQRAFDNGIEMLEQIGPTTYRINSGTREDRVYNVYVHPRRRGVDAGWDGYCTCEGAWLGQVMCQHLALAFLYAGRIDQYGNVIPRVRKPRVLPDEATVLARLEKYQDRAARMLARIRAASAEQAS